MKTETLMSLVKIYSGFAFKSSDLKDHGTIPVVRIGNVLKGYSNTYYSGNYDEIYVVNDGELLIGMTGEFNVGKWHGGKSLLNQRVCKIESKNKNKLCNNYLYYFLSKEITCIQNKKSFSTIRNLLVKDLNEVKIFLPEIEIQKRIAEILDKADGIRKKREEALKLADSFLRATFLEMFGDPVTNPKGWERKGLNDVGILARGKSKHRPRNAPDLLGGPYPLIQTGDIANSNHFITQYKQTYSELGLKQSKLWPKKTLCITIAANIADTAILTFDACFPDSVVGFIPNGSVKTEYIHMWLTFYQNIIREKAPESAQKNINLKILSELKIPISPISRQEKFVDCFKQVELLKVKMRDEEKDLEDCFNALTQRAFRGEL
jgi:type I restriction enzyme, S subunit